jgi:hypothetical protein
MNIPGIGDNTQTIDFAKVEVERLKERIRLRAGVRVAAH